MNKETLDLIDRVDTARVRRWAEQHAAAMRRLEAALAEQAELNRVLDMEPAKSSLEWLYSERGRLADAQIRLNDVRGGAEAAETEAKQYERTVVADAQTNLDAATHALSVALAEKLREASTSTALTATVDGLALRQRYLAATAMTPPLWDHTTLPFRACADEPPLDPQLLLPAVADDDYAAILGVLARLDATVDAVADLLTAESVHQLVQGNLVRSGAAIDVASSGAVPDVFDIVRTPQSGAVATHRVLMLCDATLTPRWTTREGVGSQADPMLSSWLTTMLPDPALIGVTVARRDPDSGGLKDAVTFTLDQLGLDPLALMRSAAERGELQQRIAGQARRKWQIELGDQAGVGDAVIGAASTSYQLEDLTAAAEAVRELIGKARALNEADLRSSGALPVAPLPTAVETLSERVANVEQSMKDTIETLGRAQDESDSWRIIDVLLRAADFNVASALPQLQRELPATGALRSQATVAKLELERRLASEPFQTVPGDATATVRQARARVAALMGLRLPVLAPVRLPEGPEWDALMHAPAILGAEPGTLRRWLDAYAQVRPAVAALFDAYELAETLSTGAGLDLAASQWSAGTFDPQWRGADPDLPSGLASVVVQRAFYGPMTTLAGLAIDEWTQRTPGTSQQAAVAFHFNEPESTPPQAVLVAVAPDLEQTQPNSWDVETLCDTLLSTIALARQRASAAELTTARGIKIGDAT